MRFEKKIDCCKKLLSNLICSPVFRRAKWKRLSIELLCVLVATALSPQTNENKASLEDFETDQEIQNESDQRLSDSSSDLGPLGLMEKHAPAVYEILEDPEWQELDEIGRYRVLVPELRTTWGLERSSSKELLETLKTIDQQIATGKQKRLAKNVKRILGSAQNTLFRQFSLGLEWVELREKFWKDREGSSLIPSERFDGYLDCIQSCKSKLFGCFAQSESDFERDVIEDIETALSDPARNRSSVRKWRSLEPAKGTYRLFLSMIECNQNFLMRDGSECDRIIFLGTADPAAKVESPEDPANELNPDSSQEKSAGGSTPSAS